MMHCSILLDLMFYYLIFALFNIDYLLFHYLRLHHFNIILFRVSLLTFQYFNALVVDAARFEFALLDVALC